MVKIHVWNIFDGGYPAQKNKVFVQNTERTKMHFAYDRINRETNFHLSKSFCF